MSANPIASSAPQQIVLPPAQMDELFVLLSEVDFLRGEPVDPRIAGCSVQPRDPDLVREVLLVYSPRPGLRRELRRSWGDGFLEGLAFTRECYARLERLDRFFCELLRKD
jgi:hypothetical protein